MAKVASPILIFLITLGSCCGGVDTKYAAKGLDIQGPGRLVSIVNQELATLQLDAIESSRDVSGALCVDQKFGYEFEESINRKDIVLTTDKPLILDTLQPGALPTGTNLLQHTDKFLVEINDIEGSVRQGFFTIRTRSSTKPDTYTFTKSGKTSKGTTFSDTAVVTVY